MPERSWQEEISESIGTDYKTVAEIDARIADFTQDYNTLNAFQYKSENDRARMAGLSAEILRLQNLRASVLSKEKAAAAGEEFGGLLEEVKAKIGEIGKIPTTELEKELEGIRRERMYGRGVELTPEEVTRWYDIVGKMQAPLEAEAAESLKQRYADVGRYYGGGHTEQQRKLLEDILQQRYGQALNIAGSQWAAKQSAIERALGEQTYWRQEQRRRTELPYQYWFGSIPGITGQRIAAKYGYDLPSYSFVAPAVPSYRYEPTDWEKYIPTILGTAGSVLGAYLGKPA
jgi:uncharacterized small protein (DUF1192 family)